MNLILEALHNWQGANLAFWSITIVVLASAAVAAFARSIVQAAFGLFFTLIGMAGYYVLLGSAFLAVTQIIVYVGGILVLLMFGILLTGRPLQQDRGPGAATFVLAGVLGILMLGLLGYLALNLSWVQAPTIQTPPSDVRALGELLLGKYLLPLELVGMALLFCLIGAAYLVRRQER